MADAGKKALFWVPRMLTVLYIAFLALFAMDVFEGPGSIINKLLGLLIHLIPNFALIAALVIAWKREWVGAVFFPVLGVAYIVWSWGRFDWRAPLFISGPLFLIGLLFLLGKVLTGHHREPAAS